MELALRAVVVEKVVEMVWEEVKKVRVVELRAPAGGQVLEAECWAQLEAERVVAIEVMGADETATGAGVWATVVESTAARAVARAMGKAVRKRVGRRAITVVVWVMWVEETARAHQVKVGALMVEARRECT